MTDVIELALKYGGYTNLDKVYLQTVLANLSSEEALLLVSPPPSVVNAYFAELYQKESPQRATDYYWELSKALGWMTKEPSFVEESHPFIRLNLSGKSFGFVYESADQVAQVFSEKTEVISDQLLMELAQIFPHYKVYQEAGKIKMRPLEFDEEEKEAVTLDNIALLTDVSRLKGGILKISGYNMDEVVHLASQLKERTHSSVYYGFSQREFAIYMKE